MNTFLNVEIGYIIVVACANVQYQTAVFTISSTMHYTSLSLSHVPSSNFLFSSKYIYYIGNLSLHIGQLSQTLAGDNFSIFHYLWNEFLSLFTQQRAIKSYAWMGGHRTFLLLYEEEWTKKLATRQYYVAIVQREKKFIKSKIKCMKERER